MCTLIILFKLIRGYPIVALHARYVRRGSMEYPPRVIQGEHLIFAFVSDISERKWLERIQTTMLDISQSAHSARSLEQLFGAIRVSLSALMDTMNFYVALYDERTDAYHFECFYDEHDELELHVPRVDPMSVTDYVRRTGRPLLNVA